MKFSALFAPTLREVPAEAEIPSHRLMLRAGLMRKNAGGIYSFLPLGHRVIQKIAQIIREEMDREGSLELALPILQPAEPWHQTGRWSDYGDEMFRLEDRHGRLFCLGPTHEEIVTELVSREVRSYKQLPLILYQIQNKYRDEIRPRFGVMRSREFLMKDAYSFDRDAEGLNRSYEKMFQAYDRIFKRCSLAARPVLAHAGAIGGDYNHEFIVPAETGEAEVAYCTACAFAANTENAPVRADAAAPADVSEAAPAADGEATPPLAKVETPEVRTIAELVEFLGRPAEAMIKSLLYEADSGPVLALVRGDRELNETKLADALGASAVRPADPETALRLLNAPVGFLGPVGVSGVTIVADYEVPRIVDGITGANEADAHYIHVAYGRDYRADLVADLRTITAADPCPECGARLEIGRGIELGHVFKLGVKYSERLGAYFLDEAGREQPMIMGCYGIGVTRTMAAIIEQHHDEDGIAWPMSVAPYHVDLIVINPKDERQMEAASRLYRALWDEGVETVIDDRDERPGVKFNDADLIGFPLRVTIGPRSLASGMIEVKERATGREHAVALEDAARYLREEVQRSVGVPAR